MLKEGYQKPNFISSSGSGTVINYGSGSDFLMSYVSGSTRQKVTVSTVPVPQHCRPVSYSVFFKAVVCEFTKLPACFSFQRSGVHRRASEDMHVYDDFHQQFFQM
jgi:hypothetical protein